MLAFLPLSSSGLVVSHAALMRSSYDARKQACITMDAEATRDPDGSVFAAGTIAGACLAICIPLDAA